MKNITTKNIEDIQFSLLAEEVGEIQALSKLGYRKSDIVKYYCEVKGFTPITIPKEQTKIMRKGMVTWKQK